MATAERTRSTAGAAKLHQRLSAERGIANDYAYRLGCSSSHLWNLASGVKKPSLDLRFKLLKMFKIGLKEWDE